MLKIKRIFTPIFMGMLITLIFVGQVAAQGPEWGNNNSPFYQRDGVQESKSNEGKVKTVDEEPVYTDWEGTKTQYPKGMLPEYTRVSVEWYIVHENGLSNDRYSEPYNRKEYGIPSPKYIRKIFKKVPRWLELLEYQDLSYFSQCRRAERQYQKVHVFDSMYIGSTTIPTGVTKWETESFFREKGLKISYKNIVIDIDNIDIFDCE